MSITIDPKATVSIHADIEDSARGSIIKIGAASVIESFVKIKPAGGSGDVIIGKSVYINSGCSFYSGNGVLIGNNVSIASNCVFAPVNHQFSDKHVLIQDQGFRPSKGGIIVEDDVWIGAGSIILDGTILRKGCVIGAMSLVRSEITAFSIQAGNPLSLLGWRQ
jgi:virginiamycin A acetyltransferase